MPTYVVTSPSGQKLRLTGDAPPTQQQLDQIFNSPQVNAATPGTGANFIDNSSPVRFLKGLAADAGVGPAQNKLSGKQLLGTGLTTAGDAALLLSLIPTGGADAPEVAEGIAALEGGTQAVEGLSTAQKALNLAKTVGSTAVRNAPAATALSLGGDIQGNTPLGQTAAHVPENIAAFTGLDLIGGGLLDKTSGLLKNVGNKGIENIFGPDTLETFKQTHGQEGLDFLKQNKIYTSADLKKALSDTYSQYNKEVIGTGKTVALSDSGKKGDLSLEKTLNDKVAELRQSPVRRIATTVADTLEKDAGHAIATFKRGANTAAKVAMDTASQAGKDVFVPPATTALEDIVNLRRQIDTFVPNDPNQTNTNLHMRTALKDVIDKATGTTKEIGTKLDKLNTLAEGAKSAVKNAQPGILGLLKQIGPIGAGLAGGYEAATHGASPAGTIAAGLGSAGAEYGLQNSGKIAPSLLKAGEDLGGGVSNKALKFLAGIAKGGISKLIGGG